MKVACVLAVLLAAAAAHADPVVDAAEHFALGEQNQREGRYREAIAEYEQAYGLVAHANTLYNIAVCYEKLGEWARSADYYQRYLNEQRGYAPDGADVNAKIAELRARAQPPPKTDPGITMPPPYEGTSYIGRPEFHVGLSYGLGFGDSATERFLVRGGKRFKRVLDADIVFGQFGKNDVALGLVTRLRIPSGQPYAVPFIHAAATIGRAKQDDSSIAETKFPVGAEVGGGVQLGKLGYFEVAAVLRFTRGGFDDTTTTADSYINDAMAFALDFGFVFDLGFKPPR